MGWMFDTKWTREKLIRKLTATWSTRKRDGTVIRIVCLAQSIQVEEDMLVLWRVREEISQRDGSDVKEPSRWIRCDLLREEPGWGWGYKPVGELKRPGHNSCPLEYLDMVPDMDREWKSEVIEYHRRLLEKHEAEISHHDAEPADLYDTTGGAEDVL